MNKYEIEEWILYTLYGRIEPHPSRKLKELTNGLYRKSSLPRYMEKIANNEYYSEKLLDYNIVKSLINILPQ